MSLREESPCWVLELSFRKEMLDLGVLADSRRYANENCQEAQNGNLGLSVTKSRKRSREMSSAQSRIMLKPVNPDFMPTVLTRTDEGELCRS